MKRTAPGLLAVTAAALILVACQRTAAGTDAGVAVLREDDVLFRQPPLT